jgi:hypothetical protein
MRPALTARADVPSDKAERYAKQLVAHLGRKVEWSTDGAVSTATIAGCTARVVVAEGVLTLLAEADDEDALARGQAVLADHLVRFGQRDELVVVWSRGGG